MNILVTGASGFIASYIVTQLIAEGHKVTCCVRDTVYTQRIFPKANVIAGDFTNDKTMSVWLKKLVDIEVVINCAGILYHPRKQVIWSVHYDAPKALFDASIKAGVKKIIQISALGVDQLQTDYAKSKKAADDYLLSLPIEAVVLRPSLVYGPGAYGGSSLFRGLAASPFWIPVVGAGQQQFQPIHVEDLAKTISEFIYQSFSPSQLCCAVGPQKISLSELLVELRSWLGFPSGKILHVPLWIIKWVSKLGDLMPFSSLNSTSFKMLMQNNVADIHEQENFQKRVSFKIKGFSEGLFSQPSSIQDRWHARLFFLKPLLGVSLAFIWIFTAICSLFLYPHAVLNHLLAVVGISGIGQPLCLYGAAILDFLLGLGLLLNYKLDKIISVQIILLIIYCLIIAWKLPYLWFDPLGPVAKNIPLIAATLVYWAMGVKR